MNWRHAMFTKPIKTIAHKKLKLLNNRTQLNPEQKLTLKQMDSGFEGESRLYTLLKSPSTLNAIQLFNLHFKINNSECQIDCLLIFQNECILLEVKNYRGNYYLKEGNWYLLNDQEITNPLLQAKRTELLLGRLFAKENIPFKIQSFVVFTHTNFFLYEAPRNLSIVFPPQLEEFIIKLNRLPCYLNKSHDAIADLLKSKHLVTSSFETTIDYEYDNIKKGLTCLKCGKFLVAKGRDKITCSKCGHVETTKSALIRSIEEFHLLFPERNITVTNIYDWTARFLSKDRIRRILVSHCLPVGNNRSTKYILKGKT